MRGITHAAACSVLGTACLLAATQAHAEWRHEVGQGVTVRAGLDAGYAAVAMVNANLGRGRVNGLTGVESGDPRWMETAIKPVVGFDSTAGLYGEFSAVGASTFFDGDPLGFTGGGDGRFAVDAGYLGWRSDAPENDAERVVVDISIGRRTMDIGDGFLIDDGNIDAFDDGGTWLATRQAFQRSIQLKLDYRAWHADAFFLEADKHNDEPALAGTNVEYQFTRGGHVGVTYFEIVDSNPPRLFLQRDGMQVVSVRMNDVRLDVLPQIGWWGEATRQFGSGPRARFDAGAYYMEAMYHFDALPWRPRLSYRYAYFSGAAQPGAAVRHDFDPLFYGFDKRSWGTWFQGELTGGWLLFNNNQRNHLVHLAANPRENVTVGLIGGSFDLVKGNYRGVPVTHRHFSDEINIYTDWQIHERVLMSAGYGVLFPGAGAVQGLGDDETFHLFELGLFFHF